MSDQLCRLCYEKKSELIGIFTVNGLGMNIAQTIHSHFPDNVIVNKVAFE